MSELIADVRYALRLMGRQPGFTALAVITLGLGIGSSTVVVSLVHGILLRPLPYPSPERIVRLSEEYADEAVPRSFGHISNITYHALLDPPAQWSGPIGRISGSRVHRGLRG